MKRDTLLMLGGKKAWRLGSLGKQTLVPCEVKNEIQTGEITADKWGLVKIEKLKVSKAGNWIMITAIN